MGVGRWHQEAPAGGWGMGQGCASFLEALDSGVLGLGCAGTGQVAPLGGLLRGWQAVFFLISSDICLFLSLSCSDSCSKS